MDAPPSLRPWDGPGSASLEIGHARPELSSPRRLGVGVHFGIEAIEELTGQGRALLIREPQRLNEQLLRIHVKSLPSWRVGDYLVAAITDFEMADLGEGAVSRHAPHQPGSATFARLKIRRLV